MNTTLFPLPGLKRIKYFCISVKNLRLTQAWGSLSLLKSPGGGYCHIWTIKVCAAFKQFTLRLVCYTAVFSVVTQRSSPLNNSDDTKNGCVADYPEIGSDWIYKMREFGSKIGYHFPGNWLIVWRFWSKLGKLPFKNIKKSNRQV